MTNQPEPIRKSSLPTTPPPEWEFHTVTGARTGTDGCALFPGDTGPVVVRRLVTYGDWEPVRPDRWADEPESAAVSAAVAPPTDQAAVLREAVAETLATADGWTWAHGLQFKDIATPSADAYRKLADAVLAVLSSAADRAAVLREAADQIDAGWFTTAASVTAELRRMADETATETPAVDLPTLAAALDGLHTLIATSSRDWQTYRVDAWLWAVLCGWDCEQTEHDDTCVHGALEETAARHGWDEATIAKARRYRAAVRAVTEHQPAAGARQDGAES